MQHRELTLGGTRRHVRRYSQAAPLCVFSVTDLMFESAVSVTMEEIIVLPYASVVSNHCSGTHSFLL